MNTDSVVEQTTVPKERASKVERMFHTYEKTAKGGLKRVTTVSYVYDRAAKTVTYGASQYCADVSETGKITSTYNRKAHNTTALTRRQNHPVVLTDVSDDKTIKEFNAYVRKQIYRHGVRSKN